MISVRRVWLFAVVHILFGASALLFADDRHFMIVFAVQDRLNTFEGAHTFATFSKTSGSGSDFGTYRVETHIISWLPATGDVCLFCAAERGRNFPLKESIEDALERRAKVSAWGPFEIQAELFERAKVQEARLEAGKILYKAVDEPWRFRGEATNCEHSVSDIDIDKGYLHSGIAHGNRGSWMVARHLRRWMKNLGMDHEWLYRRLKLDAYPIIRRKL